MAKKNVSEVMEHATSKSMDLGFELRPDFVKVLKMDTFGGRLGEAISSHIEHFLLKCEQEDCKGVSKDSLRLKLFPYTLRGRAKGWYEMIDTPRFNAWRLLNSAFGSSTLIPRPYNPSRVT